MTKLDDTAILNRVMKELYVALYTDLGTIGLSDASRLEMIADTYHHAIKLREAKEG